MSRRTDCSLNDKTSHYLYMYYDKMESQQKDKCECVHLDAIHKGSGPQREENKFLGDERRVHSSLHLLRPASLIFRQHQL